MQALNSFLPRKHHPFKFSRDIIEKCYVQFHHLELFFLVIDPKKLKEENLFIYLFWVMKSHAQLHVMDTLLCHVWGAFDILRT